MNKDKAKPEPVGSSYYDLFEHMAKNHGLTLLDSELEDICQVVEKMRPPIIARRISADTLLMSALEAMSEPQSSGERSAFATRLLARLQAIEKKEAWV